MEEWIEKFFEICGEFRQKQKFSFLIDNKYVYLYISTSFCIGNSVFVFLLIKTKAVSTRLI